MDLLACAAVYSGPVSELPGSFMLSCCTCVCAQAGQPCVDVCSMLICTYLRCSSGASQKAEYKKEDTRSG